MLERIFTFLTKLTISLLSILKILVRSRFFLPKPTMKGHTCFILGNGPSLNHALRENRAALRQKNLICVNGFSLTEEYEYLQPANYLIAAPEFWTKGAYEEKTFDQEKSAIEKMTRAIVEKTTWEMTLFLPAQSRQNRAFTAYLRTNSFIRLSFFNATPVEGLKRMNHLLFSWNLGGPRPHNVLIPCILMAINSNMKAIYLLGADHSWLPLVSVNENNVAMVNQQHFYDEEKSESRPMGKQGLRPRKLHEILEKFMLSFKAYFELRDYAVSRGASIFNCTPGSFIDAFDRKDLADVLIEKQP